MCDLPSGKCLSNKMKLKKNIMILQSNVLWSGMHYQWVMVQTKLKPKRTVSVLIRRATKIKATVSKIISHDC